MADQPPVMCAFCGTYVDYVKACIGFGIEKPVSKSHYFCSEEHRSEYIISETAKERGITYTVREYKNKGLKHKVGEELDDKIWDAMTNGEILTSVQEDGSELCKWIMDPFGEIKEY